MGRSRLYILISAFLGVLILLTIVYLIGLARGRGDVENAVSTAQAQAFLDRIVATETPTETPSPTQTPTITPTPTNTPTPTPSPTSSPTPASNAEWAGRFVDLATSGLNAIAGWEFTSDRAESLLRNAAQQHQLVFAPVSYNLLSTVPWAAIVVPHTPAGVSLPVLFWQDENDQNRIRAQLLTTALSTAGAAGESALAGGVEQGAFASDAQGRYHALLVERVEGNVLQPVWLLAQSQPAGDFALKWNTLNEPMWPATAQGSTILLDPQENRFLPDMVVDAPLPPTGSLRQIVRAPGTFVEQDPFARQWTNTRWTPSVGEDESDAASGGINAYQLAGAGLRSTPLTSMSQIVTLLQSGQLDSALTYAERLDLVQQAFSLGLNDPGWWLGLYLDDAGELATPGAITPRLRIFDNGDRARTFDATFNLDESGFYRLADIRQSAPMENSWVTPSAPLPTLTATAEATSTPAGRLTQVPTRTPPPTPLPVGQPTATGEPAATFTPDPGRTATPTATRTATSTPTETATPEPTATPTETPLPIPEIPAGEVAPLTGVTNVLEPARLRGGPGTTFPVLLPVGNGLGVGIFGITEAGDWMLVRIDEPGHPDGGKVGWMFRDLVYTEGDPGVLPRYGVDGIEIGALPTPTPEDAQGGGFQLPTSTPTPEPSPTATPLQTPEVRAPTVDDPLQANVPPPEGDEFMATIAGDAIPANPLAPIPAIAADGRDFVLQAQRADIQIWGGVLGQPDAEWLPASGEMLWAGAIVYVQQEETSADGGAVTASRVRIVGAPQQPRALIEDASAFASAAASADSIGLVGGSSGVSVLNMDGAVAPIWQEADSVRWLDAGDAGVVAPLSADAWGKQGFIWARTDGNGLRILAQPYFAIHGVAGDPWTGLWWIESPLVPTGRWQLWRWDPQEARVQRVLEASDGIFASAQGAAPGDISEHLLPTLVALRTAQPGDDGVFSLFVDTTATDTLQPNRGFFRIDMISDGTGQAMLANVPRRLISADAYQNPLVLSPDQNRVAFLAHDSSVPSLTAGAIRPANRIKRIVLEGERAGTVLNMYQSETPLEFIAPLLVWQDDGTLLAARSRFAPEGAASNRIDMFGAVWIEVGGVERADTSSAISTRIPAGRQLQDIAGCREEQSALLVLLNADGSLEYARWASIEPITPTFTVPNNLKNAFTCWRNPPGR